MKYPWWQSVLILGVVLAGIYTSLSTFLPKSVADRLVAWVPASGLSLGLDLQGGVQLRLTVDLDAVKRANLEAVADRVRDGMREVRARYQDLTTVGNTVRFRMINPTDQERVLTMLRADVGVVDFDITAAQSGIVEITYRDLAISSVQDLTMQQSIAVVQRRIDELGTRNAQVQRQGRDQIILEIPGSTDARYVKSLLGQTARLTFHRVYVPVQGVEGANPSIPGDVMTLPGRPGSGAGTFYVYRKVEIPGERLQDAAPSYGEDASPVVSFRFDTVGARMFGELTRDNVGQSIAIVLDDEVISAPVVNEPILGGSGIISGNFSSQESFDLALLLRTGALPAPMFVSAERTIGSNVGVESIELGKISAMVGMAFVVVIMVVLYGWIGWVVVLSLAVNILLLVGLLSALQVSLTLPGVVGMILTVGMAVDANIIIFERVNEEIKQNVIPIEALQRGFRQATISIADANITTLIAGIILFALGEGPVKGFAVTLTIGILTSMFASVIFTRYALAQILTIAKPAAWMTRKSRPALTKGAAAR